VVLSRSFVCFVEPRFNLSFPRPLINFHLFLAFLGVVLNGSQYLSNLTLVNSSVLLPDRNVSIGQNLILQNSSLTLISPNTFINGSLSLQSSEVQLSNVLPTATAAPIVVGGCVNISSSTLQVNASSLSNGTTNIPVMSYGCRNGEFLDVQVIDQRGESQSI